ncbi:MAG: tetratricopeptide repeat protein [Deltaproteobacteria bacterium]|nr:tetratricopeptide repeat protein [Deltaproteobacteria bacterium]
MPFAALRLAAAVVSCVAVLACDGQSTQRNTKLAGTHYLLAADLVRKRNPEGAKAELMRALELDPDNRDAHQLLGVVFYLEGVHAMNFLEREQCLEGRAAQEQREVANERFRRAEQHLARSVKLAAQERTIQSEDLTNLASVALHFKRYDEAIQHCDKALQNILFTNRFTALGNRGWAYFLKGDRVRAARDLRQALFYQPKFCIGRYRLAKVYYEEREYAKVITELKHVTDDKDCPIQEPFQLLGLTYGRLRQTEEARQQFDRCVALNPKSCISLECRRYVKLI